jgi:hypothetical protein
MYHFQIQLGTDTLQLKRQISFCSISNILTSVGIFGSKKEKVSGGLRKIHNEELHMYSSPDIIKMIKSLRTRWRWHEACMGEMKSIHRILIGNTG